MAAITVSSTTPTLLAQGGEGTASNPTQVNLRFADGATGTINVINDLEKQASSSPTAQGWPWPDTEVFSVTLVAGQKVWGQAVGGPIEVRAFVVNP